MDIDSCGSSQCAGEFGRCDSHKAGWCLLPKTPEWVQAN